MVESKMSTESKSALKALMKKAKDKKAGEEEKVQPPVSTDLFLTVCSLTSRTT
jgi:hypothetical protein